MKKLIPIFGLALLVTACNSNPKLDTSAISTTSQVQQAPATNVDTAGLTQFQQWKALNELSATKQYQTPAVQNRVPVVKTAKIYAATTPQPQRSTASTNSNANTSGGAMSSESANAAKAPVKKGISKTVKGTAIGAGVGAAAGAVINKKNRVLGGVIGGVLGGAVGYGIGHHMDKQEIAPLYTSN